MPPLSLELRRDLERAVVSARGLAEAAARAALVRLGVEDAEAPAALSPELRALRTALRERAKALGGGEPARPVGRAEALVWLPTVTPCTSPCARRAGRAGA